MATSTERAPRRRRRLRRVVVDLPVGRKLSVGLGSLTAVLVVVIGCLFLTVARLGAANHELVDVAAARAQAAAQLRFAAAELRSEQQAFILDPASSRTGFNQADSRFESALDALRARSRGQVDLALIKKIATGHETFLATDQLIVGALQSGHEDLARNLALGPEGLAYQFLAADASTYADGAEAERAAAVSAFHRTSAYSVRLGIALGLIALVVMGLARWFITKLIRDPLHRVQLAAERAAEGDLAAEADVDGDDETGRLGRAFNAMLAKLRWREQMLLADHQRQDASNKIHRAFEMADDEASALDVVGLTMSALLPGRAAELLLADNSQSNLEQAVVAGPNADGPGCPVASPFSCVAVRSGAPVVFASSDALDACPHLRGRGGEPCSAVCVPVTFMGRAMGVIHAVGDEGAVAPAHEIEAVSTLATQAGARIGVLRTMVRTQGQASTDALTGLINRRVFQTKIRSLRRSDTQFALVMADIDHFKRINDTHGHETGDRAIRTFCDIAQASLRHSDVIGRWGGEEFALALPGLSVAEAHAVIDRIRLELAARLSTSDLPGFTVSYGVVAADQCASLEQAVRLADNALYEAKAGGRDRTVVSLVDADVSGAVAVPRARVAERADPAAGGVLAGLVGEDDPYLP
jgi:diguanylate cyclase (GGDEF)-like protein